VKHPVKTLAALAILGAVAPSAYAVSIKDDVVSMKLGGNIQFRASLLNDASDSNGNDFDPLRGTSGQSAEAARFDIRRARLSFAAKMGDWSGNITIRSEKNDQNQNATASTANGGNGRPVQLYYAKIARDFKVGDMTHQIRFGLDKSFNVESAQSSSTFLFPTDTIVCEKAEERAVGVGYMFMMPFLNFGLDFHNGSTGTRDTDANGANTVNVFNSNGKTNGYFYSTRIEFAPGAEFMPAKRMESFYGKEGTHLVIGLDAQWDMGNLNLTNVATAGNYQERDVFTWGPDILGHWNGLTAKAEYRMRSQTADNTVAATGVAGAAVADVDGKFWDIQVAYAFPLEEVVIEPAIGYMVSDSNSDVDSFGVASGNNGAAGPPAVAPQNFGYGAGADNGGDGKTINIGVNFYWNGHDNKTQVAFQSWKAETGDADAKIIRIQHQINF
jgi:hypothetical protein